jgi:hypothetical protein
MNPTLMMTNVPEDKAVVKPAMLGELCSAALVLINGGLPAYLQGLEQETA